MESEEFYPAKFGRGVWIRGPTRGLRLTALRTLDTVPEGCGRAPDSIAFARRAGAVNFRFAIHGRIKAILSKYAAGRRPRALDVMEYLARRPRRGSRRPIWIVYAL